MNQPLRYAVVSTSRIAEKFVGGTISIIPAMKITAVYSRTKESGELFAGKLDQDITVFTDLQSLAESDLIDAVYITSPNSLHFDQSRIFIEHGKHVLCEKPAAVKPDQLETLQKLAEEKQVVYLEAMMLMHQPGRLILKEAIAEIGRVREARLSYSQLSSRYHGLIHGELPNIFNPAFAGGALMDIGVYCVNAAVDLFGMPKKTTAKSVFLDNGADASGAALLEYEDKLVSLSYSKTGQGFAPSEIIGDQGTISIDMLSFYGGIRLHKNRETILLSEMQDHSRALGFEALDFYRYITQRDFVEAEYAAMKRQMLNASRLMDEIREQAGIRFPNS